MKVEVVTAQSPRSSTDLGRQVRGGAHHKIYGKKQRHGQQRNGYQQHQAKHQPAKSGSLERMHHKQRQMIDGAPVAMMDRVKALVQRFVMEHTMHGVHDHVDHHQEVGTPGEQSNNRGISKGQEFLSVQPPRHNQHARIDHPRRRGQHVITPT